MIGSLAHGGQHLQDPRYLAAAEKAADFILTTMQKEDRLMRTYRDKEAKLNAYLDDYTFLADGFLDLYQVTRRARWLNAARRLMDTVIKRHSDQTGGLFFTSDDHENLLIRVKAPFDRATPSGNGVAARVLVRLGRVTGEERYRKLAELCFDTFLTLMDRDPQATQSLILALGLYFEDGPPLLSLGFADGTSQPDAQAQVKPVTVDAFASRAKVAPGATAHVAVRLTIDAGWHVNSHQPLGEGLVPTALRLKQRPAAKLGTVTYPEGKTIKLAFSPEPLSVYEGTVWISAAVRIPEDAAAGPATLQFEVPVQACNDRVCLQPQILRLAIPLGVVPGLGETPPRHRAIFESLRVSP